MNFDTQVKFDEIEGKTIAKVVQTWCPDGLIIAFTDGTFIKPAVEGGYDGCVDFFNGEPNINDDGQDMVKAGLLKREVYDDWLSDQRKESDDKLRQRQRQDYHKLKKLFGDE